ncbi:NADPH-dependent FMN reductase [Cellulomonas uda]|uniref:Putative reductase n=1 Tax=Cellulomonas uda TaxID=1714 RepID=A0A4Y3KI03_CELUD|nr:NAD(P)H-dependent oxidoreductase [Cellulomonas uda]NII66667.1 NAD(P)H-dependent FMN reductase [Cellulomonas uda]GEA82695.1 putative reductase [Cellulomonas uda]
MSSQLKVALVVASVREQRFGPVVAGWVREQLEAHGGFEVDVLDLVDVHVPVTLDGSGDTEALRARIGAADAFVVVTPEYNHGYPGYLKIVVDTVLEEWAGKALGFVSYGGSAGGSRSVEQLRQVFTELQVHTIRRQVVFSGVWDRFDDEGRLVEGARYEGAAKSMFDQLVWWAAALREARRTPVVA